jgi:hypothetical protein
VVCICQSLFVEEREARVERESAEFSFFLKRCCGCAVCALFGGLSCSITEPVRLK